MRTLFLASTVLASGLLTGASQAAVITFDASNNGQTTLPGTYQPLLGGYVGDGGALGVTINWGGLNSSDKAVNGGVTDHTPASNGDGYVGYDGGAYSNTISFDKAVTLPSFYFAKYYGGGPFTITFQGFANLGDLTPLVSLTRTFSQTTGPNGGGYQWIEETGLAGYDIKAFSISGDNYKQLDDITVLSAAPEPSSWALMFLGFGGLGAVLRRRRARTAARAA